MCRQNGVHLFRSEIRSSIWSYILLLCICRSSPNEPSIWCIDSCYVVSKADPSISYRYPVLLIFDEICRCGRSLCNSEFFYDMLVAWGGGFEVRYFIFIIIWLIITYIPSIHIALNLWEREMRVICIRFLQQLI